MVSPPLFRCRRWRGQRKLTSGGKVRSGLPAYLFILESSGLFRWLRRGAQVWLHRGISRKRRLCFFVTHRAGDNHVAALLPVGWSSHLILRRELQRIKHANDLIKVPAGGHWVGKRKLDPLVRPNHKHCSNWRVQRWGAPFAGIARIRRRPVC